MGIPIFPNKKRIKYIFQGFKYAASLGLSIGYYNLQLREKSN